MTDESGFDGNAKAPDKGRKEISCGRMAGTQEGHAGLAEPVLVHLERAEEQIREGRKIDQNGHFRE